MTYPPVSEADRLKFAEIWKRSLGASEGGKPGKRKRGYHRALKRGEMWAVHQNLMYQMGLRLGQAMFNLSSEPNCPEDTIYMYSLSQMLEKK